MLAIPGKARIFLCHCPIDMRKSFEGLSLTVGQLFPGELTSGAFFVFLNQKRDHIKVLVWDDDGFIIWYKRLEKGTFAWKWGEVKSMDRRAFLMLLEGIIPKRLQPRFSH